MNVPANAELEAKLKEIADLEVANEDLEGENATLEEDRRILLRLADMTEGEFELIKARLEFTSPEHFLEQQLAARKQRYAQDPR